MIKSNNINKQLITEVEKTVINEIKLLNKNLECITLILFENLTKNMTDQGKSKIDNMLLRLKK